MQGIAEYLTRKNILITGATGFLGQPLIEKILFSAPNVRRVYALIRPSEKLGGRVVSAESRLELELYKSSAFDRLRGVYGDKLNDFFKKKLRAVSGDISKDDLGIDHNEKIQLQQEIDVVINCAAVVSFDALLDEALSLNVLAAGRVARFAESCRASVLVHVSTAYVNGVVHKNPPEAPYHGLPKENKNRFTPGYFSDVYQDIEKVESIIKDVYRQAKSKAQEREFTLRLLKESRKKKRQRPNRKNRLEQIRKTWTQEQLRQGGMQWARERGWNDTYTYTKAMGEQLVLAACKAVSAVILRPSIIESSLSEPCPGWLDGLRMADPLIAAIGKGRLKSLPLDPDVLLDLVPVDVVVNALLASLPAAADREGGLQVYQVATSSRNPITLGELYDLIFRYFKRYPMLDKKGRAILIRRLRFLNPSTFRLQHQLRSVPLQTAEKTLERLAVFETTKKVRRRILAAKLANQKLYYYGEIYEPYLNLDCQFKVDRTAELFESLTPGEKKRFNFDVTRINWRHYIQNVHIPGVKKFILKIEGAGTMELESEASKLPAETINELLDKSCVKYSERVALQIQRNGDWQRYKYKDLKAIAEETGRRFYSHGLRKGDRVVLFSENQPEWGLAYLGAMRNGLTVVPVDAQTWHKELWSLAEFTEARAILASERCFSKLKDEELAENEASPSPILLFNIDQKCQVFQRSNLPRSCASGSAPEHFDLPTVGPDDSASIIFTTGTMVDPRGAVHTHRNFLTNLFGVNKNLPIKSSDVVLSVLPLYHALEFTCGFLMPISGGAKIVYATTLKPRMILETMRRTGTTCMLGVPTLYSLLRDYLERKVLGATDSTFKASLMATSKQISRSLKRRLGRNVGRKLFSKVHQEFGGKVRVFVSGGSPLSEDIFEDFNALGMPIYEGYGLTETAPVLTVNPLNRSRARSAGRPLPGVEVRLDHPDKHGVGEIVVRSPSLMKKYFKNNGATRAVMEGDWFHTGDLGWVDVDGYIYITGRIKDVIVTGAGKNVYPMDLEAIYQKIEGIQLIGVAGIPKGLTEEIHAVVQLDKNNAQDRGAQEKKIREEIRRLARELPSYHRLQRIHFLAGQIPANEDGEIDRPKLRRLLSKEIKKRNEPDKTKELLSGKRGQRANAKNVLISELSKLSGIPESAIHDSTDLYQDLGLDSLQAIKMLLLTEEVLGLSIPDEQAEKLTKVGELFDLLRLPEPQKTALGPQPSSALPLPSKSVLDRALLNFSFAAIETVFRSWFGLSVSNESSVFRGQPYILAANHSSHLDTGAVVAALAHSKGLAEALTLHVLGARDYFFSSKWKGWMVSKLFNVVPIERHENSLAGLKLVEKILKSGESVLIYPEGSRSRNGKVQGFKAGLGLIAWELQVPIIPTTIFGTHKALPAGKSWPTRHPITVCFGEPVYMDRYSDKQDKLTREKLYKLIASDVQTAVQSFQVNRQDA